MFVVLSPAHPDPMYKQVTDQIKDAIASGDLKPNDRLPSVRELSEALTRLVRASAKFGITVDDIIRVTRQVGEN